MICYTINGNIDYGLFAIQNAVGGVVEESTHAMAKYKFRIVDEFQILIRHFLMKRKDIAVDENLQDNQDNLTTFFLVAR